MKATNTSPLLILYFTTCLLLAVFFHAFPCTTNWLLYIIRKYNSLSFLVPSGLRQSVFHFMYEIHIILHNMSFKLAHWFLCMNHSKQKIPTTLLFYLTFFVFEYLCNKREEMTKVFVFAFALVLLFPTMNVVGCTIIYMLVRCLCRCVLCVPSTYAYYMMSSKCVCWIELAPFLCFHSFLLLFWLGHLSLPPCG